MAKIGDVIKLPQELEAGRWYAVGIANIEDVIEWGGAMLLKYEGDDCWSDESGEVEFIYDPLIQQRIPVSDADAFMVIS